MEMWMGAWAPVVRQFLSNWKELWTLLITMEHLVSSPQQYQMVKDITVFYFTDNEVTYYIASSGTSPTPALHALIE